MNKLSIITINLNNAQGLQKTIESIVSQTFTDLEYIIIDGASTDRSIDVIKQYADKITYWVSEPDKGIYNAMNKGILQAKGEYCLFLNSGDRLVDKFILEKVFTTNLHEDIVYGGLIRVSEDEIIKKEKFPPKLSLLFFYGYSLPHPATFIRRSLFNNNLYNESYKIISDWLFFVNMIIFNDASYRYLDIFISYFDINGSSAISPTHQKERKEAMDLLLPKHIQEDYDVFLLYKNLKINNLVYFYFHGSGMKKLIASFIIKCIICYNIFCSKF